MFVIVLTDESVRPDARLTVRHDRPRGGRDAWQREISCFYDPVAREWRSAPIQDSDLPLRFKFLRDNAWELGDAHEVTKVVDGRHVAQLNPQGFSGQSGMIVSNPVVAQRFFPPALDVDRPFDVYVIGSGIGGGMLAHTAARRRGGRGPANVLVLEAGSYLFPTHVGNLPRRSAQHDNEATRLWSLWYEFRTKRDGSLTGDGIDLAEGLCLGGKSVFWGALVPEMSATEFARWPGGVAGELNDRWYSRAKGLLNAEEPPFPDYQKRMRDRLSAELPGLKHEDAQLAVQRLPNPPWGLPAGVFSTADLLLEDRLQRETADHLTINLNHQVTRLVFEGAEKRVRAIVCQDLVAGRERVFQVPAGADVVLAAGTLSSPVIALNSGLDHALIGRGITDHATYYRKFVIPPRSTLYDPVEVGKVVLRRPGEPALNVIVSLGSDLYQTREVDDEAEARRRDGGMPCEVVFFYEGALVDTNQVSVTEPGTYARPTVKVASEKRDDIPREVRSISATIITQVCQGVPLSDVERAKIGGVGHEVGTLRMGAAPADAVVDENLRVFGTRNLFVCDLSTFPTSPAANPTLTLAALAVRLEEHLAGRRNRR